MCGARLCRRNGDLDKSTAPEQERVKPAMLFVSFLALSWGTGTKKSKGFSTVISSGIPTTFQPTIFLFFFKFTMCF